MQDLYQPQGLRICRGIHTKGAYTFTQDESRWQDFTCKTATLPQKLQHPKPYSLEKDKSQRPTSQYTLPPQTRTKAAWKSERGTSRIMSPFLTWVRASGFRTFLRGKGGGVAWCRSSGFGVSGRELWGVRCCVEGPFGSSMSHRPPSRLETILL